MIAAHGQAQGGSRLVVLAVDPDAPAHEIPIHEPGAPRTIVAVPGEHVHLAWLALPSRTSVQARAAARVMLADRLAVAPDRLHVAVSDTVDPTGLRLVAAVDPALMAGWLARVASPGGAPAALVPDCLLLPAPLPGDDSIRVLEIDGRWLCRGARVAFAADAALADVILGDRPRSVVEVPGRDALLARGAAAPPLDLLQDAFATVRPANHAKRRIRWLAAAILLMPLLFPAAFAARDAWIANVLRDRAIADATALLGADAVGGEPLAAAQSHLAALQRASELPRSVAALADAIASRPGTRLESIQYRADGGLVAGVVHGGGADLAALDLALRESGLALAIVEEGSAPDGRQRSDLRIEPAP